MCASGEYQTIVTEKAFIYISADFGETWTKTYSFQNNDLITSVSVSGTGQFQTVVGKSSFCVSRDFGYTWNSVSFNSSSIIYDMKYVSTSSSGYYQNIITTNSLYTCNT